MSTGSAPNMKKAAVDPVLAVVIAAAAVLLFWNLGSRDLWQDEAETAMLAKNILRFKLPVVFDGINLVSTETGMDHGPDMIWRWSPWLQFYTAAGSMAMFGLNTLAARLPFAFLGLLCLPLTYAFARRNFDSERIARLSAIILGLSVPFLLHCRQARWYSLAYLFAIGMCFSLLELDRRPRTAAAALAASAILLFYTNYFVAIGLLAAVCLAAPVLKPSRSFWKHLAAALAIVAACTIPGIRFFHVFEKAIPLFFPKVASFLAAYAGLFFLQLLPLPMLAALIWSLMMSMAPVPQADPGPRRRTLFLLTCCGLYIGYLACGPWVMSRYLTLLLPLCAILLAVTLDRALTFNRSLGITLCALLVGTDILHSTPLGFMKIPGAEITDRYGRIGPFSFPLPGFAHEISHDLQDCSRPLIEKLKSAARPTDTVLVTYGDSPLQFYTGLKVVGGFQGQKLPLDPDWIVMRSAILDRRPGRDYDVLRFILQDIDLQRCYEPVELPCSDLMLANCSEPRFHLFQTPPDRQAMKVLHRICAMTAARPS